MARHASLADQLGAIRDYIFRPEADAEPVQTNWTITPANDNNPEDVAGLSTERLREITPSVEAIMRSASGAVCINVPRADIAKAKGEHDTFRHPVGGDIERNKAGQIVRIGALRFSDGEQFERGYKLVMGEPTATALRMPVGAMLGTSEKAKTEAGGSGDDSPAVTASDKHFADMFDVRLKPRKPAGRNKRTGRSYTATESRSILAEAYANTDMSKVTITRYPAGLPRAGARISDSFIGMKKGGKGESGSMAWQDISTSMVNREMWAETVAYLMDEDRAVLDAVATAKTMADIAPDRKGGNAFAAGRKRLQAANDNLTGIMRKAAS